MLPGTARTGSPIVISPYANIFFIEPNGDVVNDYLSGSRWKGPAPIGGTAGKGSGLAFYPGGSTPATRAPAVVFVNARGQLAHDYFEPSGWHGPAALPGAPRAGSPIAWSGDGTSVYFIERNGDVVTHTYPDPAGEGPSAPAASRLTAPLLATPPVTAPPPGRPNVVFVASDGTLAHDRYHNGWHGPYHLPSIRTVAR